MQNKPLLKGVAIEPISGEKPKQLVIYLHGMGGNGTTNAWFAKELQSAMPDAIFYVPDGLESMDGNPEARQWFSIPKEFDDNWFTMSPEELPPEAVMALAEMYAFYQPSAVKICNYIKERMTYHEISAKDTYIVGVSQGAMTAVQMIAESDCLADVRPDGSLIPLGGVMIIAGCLINVSAVLEHASKSCPEFIFVHGSEDDTVPFQGYVLTDKTLHYCGQKTSSKIVWGKDHTFFEKEAMSDILRLAKTWGNKAQRI